MSDQPVYQSSNGDSWFLVSDDPANGKPMVKHVANPQSGGHVSLIDLETFLSSGNGPEQQAFRQLPAAKPVATLLVAYDVHPANGPRYEGLTEAIQSLGAWWHHLETVWIVRSSKTPEELRDQLQRLIGADDQLLIVDITATRAGWSGVNEAGSKWLAENILAKTLS